MMVMPYVMYVAVVALAGAFGFLRTRGGSARNSLPAVIISVCSLLMLIYLLSTFASIKVDTTLRLFDWQLPFAGISAGIDPLTAFFLIPLLILAVACSLYGPQYFKAHPAGRSHWFLFGLLVAGMVMVLLARNAVLFVIAWEIMSLSSFFLVISDERDGEALRAGWIYFITAHIGTAFLLALFFLLASISGSFDFAAWKAVHPTDSTANVIFVLALVAFGLKAGFVPFHVWLPLAHPSAPSHVSALMSGIMIKMGIYGLLRMLTFLAPYHAWWGTLLIVIGGVSGVMGVLFAIGQHDIKRLLAYHSVENIGIILLGIGIGITGAAHGSDVIALFGFAGGLLHVLNHSLFKGLLFLGAGSILRQTGTGEIDTLGGLIKTMPRTALLFLIGSIAICGLPFFNGFISELMIYVAGMSGAMAAMAPTLSMASLVVVVALALIGGLAAACFTKVFGVVFLGEPRTEASRVSGDVPAAMLMGMAFLAVLCIVVGIASPVVVPFLTRPALLLAGATAGKAASSLSSMSMTVSIVLASVLLLIFFVLELMRLIRSRRTAARDAFSVTWDCGYSRPEASMQYTASSFAAPIMRYFRVPVSARDRVVTDGRKFPRSHWSFHSTVDDWFLTRLYTPAIGLFGRLFASMHWFQSGKTGQYVLYIAITAFCLIMWKFFL
jgi:hydrogenase-4 component B